jgi:hypothetical protein
MRRKHLNDTDLQSLLAMLDRHSAHLVRLVDDLLDVSRLTQGTIRVHSQVLDIASVVARAVEASRPVIDAHAHTLCLARQRIPDAVAGVRTSSRWASQLSGYPFPDRLPEVQWKSESWFSHRVCKDHIPCPVFGLYEDHDVVFLREDLTVCAKDQTTANF